MAKLRRRGGQALLLNIGDGFYLHLTEDPIYETK